jgi:hypothetical protein
MRKINKYQRRGFLNYLSEKAIVLFGVHLFFHASTKYMVEIALKIGSEKNNKMKY